MKLSKKLLLLSLTAAGGLISLTGCGGGGEKGPANQLWVAFAECGFGRQFMEEWGKAYNEANPDDQIKLKLEGDAGMTADMVSRIQSGKNLPDIAMLLCTNWQPWAAKGQLEPLDDVYQADSGLNDGTKMIDVLDEGIFFCIM